MAILAVKGFYRNGVAVPHERLNVAESEVVIVFLQDMEKKVVQNIINYYQKIAKGFDFGRKADREYGKELTEVYPELMSAQEEVAKTLGLDDED
ncbi:hypothetical protein ISS37_08030 [candidate division KSB1 bacterium]|nr:hypothetical protein [candidate division KSB1 bacterium]